MINHSQQLAKPEIWVRATIEPLDIVSFFWVEGGGVPNIVQEGDIWLCGVHGQFLICRYAFDIFWINCSHTIT